MSILNYTEPQLTIRQRLQRTSPGVLARINAAIIGPRFELSRYGKEKVESHVFNSAGGLINFSKVDSNDVVHPLQPGQVVDPASVKVHGTGLEALLANLTGLTSTKLYLYSVTEPNVLVSSAPIKGTGLATELRGRDAAIGDYVYVDDGVSGFANRRRKIVGFRGVNLPSSFGSNVDNNDGNMANSSFNPITDDPGVDGDFAVVSQPVNWVTTVTNPTAFNAFVRGSKLGNRYGEQFTLTCHTGGAPGTATFNISSASGLWSATNVPSTAGPGSSYDVTHPELAGLTVNLNPSSGQAAAGMVFKFNIFGKYTRLTPADLEFSGTYNGTEDTTYMIQVITGTSGGNVDGAVVRISDSKGTEPIQMVTVVNNTNFAVGTHGLVAKFVEDNLDPTMGLRAGDIFYVNAVASKESTTSFNKVVLDGPAVDVSLFSSLTTPLDVEFRLPFTGNILATAANSGVAWTATPAGVNLQPGLSLFVSSRQVNYQWVPFVNNVGTLELSFRATVPASANEDLKINYSLKDIEENCGPIDLDNDLAYAVKEAFNGAQGRAVYSLNVTTNDLAGFNAALAKLESTDMTYALSVVTTSESIMQAAGAHAAAMSQPNVKNFRRVYVGSDSPGSYPVLVKDTNGNTATATITSNGSGNLLVSLSDPNLDLTVLNLSAGDIAKFPGLNAEYPIANVISATELVLASGPVSPVSPATAIEIWRADTPDSQADFIIARSKSFANRRVNHIWVEQGAKYIDGVRTLIPARYVAAHIAGLRSAKLPQQGLTRTEVTTITEAPRMYLRYNREILNRVAAEGTFIVTQDMASQMVYIRHQLTTDVSNGSLYYEDSVGTNLDNISFALKELDALIGRRNANPQTVSMINNRLDQILTAFTQTDADTDVGPALIEYRDAKVALDPILKDRINVSAVLTMPLPLNNIDVELNAVVSGS
jgi:hypothetical protein